MSNKRRLHQARRDDPVADIFPAFSADEVMRRTEAAWDLSRGYPIPRGTWLGCPVCRDREIQGRFWIFFERPVANATVKLRCDVHFKCCRCAAIWVHGVALPDGYLEQHRHGCPSIYSWRQVRYALTGVGWPEPPDPADMETRSAVLHHEMAVMQMAAGERAPDHTPTEGNTANTAWAGLPTAARP